MLGVKYYPEAMTFCLGEESDLTCYDEDLNDPPLELKEEVEQWLRDNIPTAKVDYARAIFDIYIIFDSEESATLFKTFWL